MLVVPNHAYRAILKKDQLVHPFLKGTLRGLGTIIQQYMPDVNTNQLLQP